MPQPTIGDGHVNKPLTNVSIAYMQDAADFIATRVFPVIRVPKRSDVYFTYDRGYFNRDEAQERAPGAESAGSGYAIDTESYMARVWAWHHDIPDQVRANADAPHNPDMVGSQIVAQKLLLRREKLFMTNYFATGLWTNEVAGAATPTGTQVLHWDDAASTPIENVTAARTAMKQLTGFDPNVMVISRPVWDALSNHPDILDRIKYGQTSGGPAIVTRQAVAAIMQMDRIEIANAIENTAAEGAANSHAFIGGKHAGLFYSNPTPSVMMPSAGYTFAWVNQEAGWMGSAGDGVRVKRMYMDKTETTRIEGQMAIDPKLVAADLGYFFNGVVS